MKKLICFDMDMTLLDHGTREIPKSAREGIRKLKENGHVVAIASGRDMDDGFSSGLAEKVEPHAIVHCNGQKVTVGNRILREIFMDKELIRRLIVFGEDHEICVGFHMGKDGAFTFPEVVKERETKTFGSCEKNFVSPWRLLDGNFYALAMFGKDAQDTIRKAAQIEQAFPEIKCALFSRNEGADVILRQASKAEGIKCLLDYYGLEKKDVVAFGDSMNDIEMIREAGVGVAMGNAIEALKKEADFVTKPIWEDGILFALEKLGLV